jgi:hypothetical protein
MSDLGQNLLSAPIQIYNRFAPVVSTDNGRSAFLFIECDQRHFCLTH